MTKTPACVLSLLVVFTLAATGHAALYTGSLTYTSPSPPGAGDELYVQGTNWPGFDVTMSWEVTDADAGAPSGYPWKYSYQFQLSGTQGALSHLIIEASDGFSTSDISGVSGEMSSSYEIGTQNAGPGNPNMPEAVYGIKFNPSTSDDYDVSWSFYSNRVPVWGDFYAKCGTANTNTAFNADSGQTVGFISPDVDPSDSPSAGNSGNHYLYHILRPDSAVPEPSTLVGLVSMGLVGLGFSVLRRRQGRT